MIYEVEWRTEVSDKLGSGEARSFTGTLRLEAPNFMEAAYLTEVLVDVDFFYPNEKVSASNHRVLSGYLVSDGVQYSSMDDAWPEIVEAWFDRIDIVAVRESDDSKAYRAVLTG